MKLKGCSQARYDSLQPRRKIVSWEEYVLWLLWVSFLSLALALSIALILGITDWNVCFSWINSHVEALTPSMTSTRVELGLPRKLLGLNEVIRMGPWTNRTRVLMRRDMRQLVLSFSVHTQGRNVMWAYRRKVAVCRLRRQQLYGIATIDMPTVQMKEQAQRKK